MTKPTTNLATAAGRSALVGLTSFVGPARAAVDWVALTDKSRELSMSGILGLVDTEILFAEPGTEQFELWRLLQSLVGLGSLRVVSRICRAPCWEFLHTAYGIKPPEGVEAREFWLRQPSWTEMSRLGLSQEDTSYHRINQGSGPQLKILWNLAQLDRERSWWEEDEHGMDGMRGSSERDPNGHRPSISISLVNKTPSVRSKSSTGGAAAARRDDLVKGVTPEMYRSRRGNDVSEGTTDKWFMDRWQCEVLGVAAVHGLTVAQASEVLTLAYFGNASKVRLHILIAMLCCFLTAGTFVTAFTTDWSWTVQLAALTCLGYFTNRTACLRAWKFEPNKALVAAAPLMLESWPGDGDFEESAFVRIAVQSSGFCHLRGVVAFDKARLEEARSLARGHKGRWRAHRALISPVTPYDNHDHDGCGGGGDVDRAESDGNKASWLSYEIQSSWYGLVSTVEADNVALRSASAVLVVANGIILLMLGFGASVADGWSAIVLGIYVGAIVVAIASRGRGSQWTMPEFDKVDLTNFRLPPAVKHRLQKKEEFGFLTAREAETTSSSQKV